DIPTLVMVGNYDPVTPPVWGRIAAETLSNSTYAEFIGVGHASIDAGDCPLSIALRFIDDPTALLDLSCIASMKMQFVTEMPDLSDE
ncbi:MAG TPA: alpha/beta hydrolase, partial [Aggregatilineales bacterium]|nr:alpha/beta hydrolase [Aggregatilineales bacterium]